MIDPTSCNFGDLNFGTRGRGQVGVFVCVTVGLSDEQLAFFTAFYIQVY
jgi:hypothetical protein